MLALGRVHPQYLICPKLQYSPRHANSRPCSARSSRHRQRTGRRCQVLLRPNQNGTLPSNPSEQVGTTGVQCFPGLDIAKLQTCTAGMPGPSALPHAHWLASSSSTV
ncbi:hypothetical protein RHMOL_Rhmol07G0205500 [Rhododendron molle]|uniref:Uncharacterized protein n=1 Tax=Rhododendron molle TaxID=49168 RepID=A0ACC0N4R2_RHOML|nr:hypothetical protein RHMOL_Rhmol07G0205500 [Rhododendron molle]